MRRLIVLLLATIGLVALGTAPAQAQCDVEPAPRAQQLKSTPYVFSGVVTDANPVSSEPGTVRYTVSVNRVYRGDVERTATVSAPSTVAECGLRKVSPGTTLMFFAERADQDLLRTQSTMGTSRLTQRARTSVEDAMGRGTVPKQADEGDEDASGTVVDDSEPLSISTAILPGAGLMLLGLLLVLVARIFGRPVRP